MAEPKTHALDVPGAVLHYDVRRSDASAEPVLLLIGSPMGAEGFGTLAGHFADRTVVTYDPRGTGRSKRTDGARQTTTEEHADDLHRLIAALDAGPVDIFASSGGAVNALALVARHREQVRLTGPVSRSTARRDRRRCARPAGRCGAAPAPAARPRRIRTRPGRRCPGTG
jgi:pimeloyl-ACP methyl ester carboxylesterase